MDRNSTIIFLLIIAIAAVISVYPVILAFLPDKVISTKASWYSEHESRQPTASGTALEDEGFTVASWDYPFGTILCITNRDNFKRVLVVVNDRGPAKRLCRQGRRIDLSKAAFESIADLKEGVINVQVEKVE